MRSGTRTSAPKIDGPARVQSVSAHPVDAILMPVLQGDLGHVRHRRRVHPTHLLVVPAERVPPFGDPSVPSPHHGRRAPGEGLIPRPHYRHGLIRAKGRVPLRQRVPEGLKSHQVSWMVQRKGHVQESATTERSLVHDADIGRRKDHGTQPPDRIPDALRLRTVDRHLTTTTRSLIRRSDLSPRALRVACGNHSTSHPEDILPKCDEVLHTSAPKRTEGLQIVDSLKQIRLPLSVRADDRHAPWREGKLLVTEVAKTPNFQHAQVQGSDARKSLEIMGKFNGARALQPPVSSPGYSPLNAALRFSRKAVIPSFMSAVEASNPNSADSKLAASAGAEFCAK